MAASTHVTFREDGRKCGSGIKGDSARKYVNILSYGILTAVDSVLASVEQWDNVMKINGRGTMLCYKHAAEQMIKQGNGGRILGA